MHFQIFLNTVLFGFSKSLIKKVFILSTTIRKDVDHINFFLMKLNAPLNYPISVSIKERGRLRRKSDRSSSPKMSGVMLEYIQTPLHNPCLSHLKITIYPFREYRNSPNSLVNPNLYFSFFRTSYKHFRISTKS